MSKRPSGLLGFVLVQIGQIISLLGSGMTMFAISIFAFQQTGQATTLSTLAVAGFAPVILFSPIAGAIVDRSNRKLVMMVSDLAAGLTTVAIFILLKADMLEIWHLYITNFIAGIFQAFQWPAYSAAVTMMVPKEQYGRAYGLMSLAGPASNIFAPLLAASLIGFIGIEGIMLIDIITFSAAIGALLLVIIPQPEKTAEGEKAKSNLLQESLFGFKYIAERPSLLGLQLIFFYMNFVGMLGFILRTPLILANTGNNEIILGAVMSFGSVGGLLGGVFLSAWGGPKRRIHGVLLSMSAIGLFSQVLMGLGIKIGGFISFTLLGVTGSGFIWALASFISGFILPILNGSNQAIWQSKVPPDLQGRVFSVRRWIAQITAPIAMLLAGPLADKVFEPGISSDGAINAFFGVIVGTAPGSGMSAIFLIVGVFAAVGGLGAYLFPSIRNVEAILPDHEVDVEKVKDSVEPVVEESLAFETAD